ncbi:MAG: ATP-binding protein [Acidobacteria bacterium]|nr:ATP-binding protein [Acidobacteriota bacterium]
MSVGLAVGVTAAVTAACAAGAYVYSLHHFESLIETARTTALAEGELITAALEHQMIENDRSLIARMIETFGKQPRIESVALLDRFGIPRFTSSPLLPTGDLTLKSPTCQSCHQYPAEKRGTSRVIETQGGIVLRTVVPVRNKAECHRCHDANLRINGILILDINAGEIRTAMNRDLRYMVAGSCALTLLLVGAIAIVVRVAVLRRLQRFETTARLIAAGDLSRRVPAGGGSDTVSWLAREFNTMADSVTGLVGEVRSQRERLETIINSIDDGIAVLDGKRQVIAANDAFLQRTGRSRDQVLGMCCQDVTEGMCDAADCPTVGCLESGERQVHITERRGSDGTPVWEEVHTSPIRDAAGKVLNVVEVWRDISDRRAAEARLAESHRLASLGVLASGFSHELNTPLGTVLMCVEGILREAQTSEPGGADLGRIGESATIARDQVLRCRGITQHFLRLSRGQPSAGDIVEVPAIITAVARLIEPTARAHSVTIAVEPPAEPLRVRADEAELQHALINLVLNAIQACKQGGRVVLSTEGGPQVHLRVADDGCGIQPEFQSRIFEPFFSMRKGGTGLGLFLSLNFVRRWGGDIVVSSTQGKGSTFEVVLPAFGSTAGQESA